VVCDCPADGNAVIAIEIGWSLLKTVPIFAVVLGNAVSMSSVPAPPPYASMLVTPSWQLKQRFDAVLGEESGEVPATVVPYIVNVAEVSVWFHSGEPPGFGLCGA
jgi:hypothetical protein